MNKIVVAQPLDISNIQMEKLKEVGEVVVYDDMPSSYEDWFDRVKDADVICSGKYGLKQKWRELENVFISLPFVGVGWVDVEEARDKNITFAKSPGCNKEPVSEWIVGMMINLLRKLPEKINAKNINSNSTQSLAGKRVCICGTGNIGSRVGEICEALNMNIVFFRKGDDLLSRVKDADVIVDVLSLNVATENIYNREFFENLKKGSYFITVTSDKLWDVNAMIDSLNCDVLAGVANDCGGIQVDDSRAPLYERMRSHPKILATAHTAYNTDRRNQVCNDMMIENIIAWINNKPINLV